MEIMSQNTPTPHRNTSDVVVQQSARFCNQGDIPPWWQWYFSSLNLLSKSAFQRKTGSLGFVRLSAWFLLSGAPAGRAPTHRFGGKLIIWHMGCSFHFLTKQKPQRSLSLMHLTSQNSSPTQQRTPQVIGVMQSQNNNSGNRGPRPLEQVTCYKVMQRGGLRREGKKAFSQCKKVHEFWALLSRHCVVPGYSCGNWPWVLRLLPCCDNDKFCRTLLSANKQQNPAPKTERRLPSCTFQNKS